MTESANPGATGLNVDPTTLGRGGTLGRQLVVTIVAILLGLLVGAILIIVSGLIGPSAHAGPDPAAHRVRRDARGRARQPEGDREHPQRGDAR